MDLDEATVRAILAAEKTLATPTLRFEWKGPYMKARAAVESSTGFDLAVEVTYNPNVAKMSGCLFARHVKPNWARLYGVDIGDDHHNPDCQMTGDPHRHNRWSVAHGSRVASPAPEFAGLARDAVIELFLSECGITTKVQVAWL